MLTQIVTILIVVSIIGCILYGRRLIKTEKVDAVFGNPERAKGGTHWVIVGSSAILMLWLYYSWDIAKGFYPKSANELCQVAKINESLLGLKYQFPIEEREFKSTSIIKIENKNLVKIATVFAVAAASGKAYVRLAPGFSSPDVGDISNAPDIINSNSLTATLQKKGNQGWATDIIFEGTDWDDIKWHKVGSSDSTNANVSFSDGTNEAITYGTKTFSGSELNKTIYAYKAVGDSASGTIVFTTDYTALYQDDRILLATFVTAASDDGTDSPSIFPFNGSQPTISAGLISAGAIVAEQIKSGTITTTQLNFTPETNSSDKTAGTVGGWKLNSSNIYSGSSPVTSGYSSAADITLTSSGTIHAKQFYIDSSGNANFKGDISGASGTFTGSLTGATGSFGDCQLTSDGFVAVGSTLGFGVKSGSSWYGAIGYTGGSMILSTTTTDKSTITP